MLSDHGILAAHDIHSLEYPSVNKDWNEFKRENNFIFKEIVCKKILLCLRCRFSI